MKCTICGDNDAIRAKYDERRDELVVTHADGTQCKLQPAKGKRG